MESTDLPSEESQLTDVVRFDEVPILNSFEANKTKVHPTSTLKATDVRGFVPLKLLPPPCQRPTDV